MNKELVDIPDIPIKKVNSQLSKEDINKLFEYEDGDLYWKIDIYSGKNYIRKHVKKGQNLNCS